MNNGPIAAIVVVTLLASLTFPPTAAFADRFRGRGVGPTIVRGPVVSRSVVVHPFVHRPFVPRPFFRPVIPFGVIGAPVVAYPPSPLYYAPPTYYDSPSVYAPSVYDQTASGSVAVAPAPPPTPSVVQYPNGRYELRGDGITTPYTWVWIPNPPPPPPPAAPPEGALPSSSRNHQLYYWTDEQGAAHWTDNRDVVPPRYRAQAKRLQLFRAVPD